MLCDCVHSRKYIRRDTGDTSKLRNADTLFDELDNILSVSCLKPPLIKDITRIFYSVHSGHTDGILPHIRGGGDRHAFADCL